MKGTLQTLDGFRLLPLEMHYGTLLTFSAFRGMAYPPIPNRRAQNILRHHPWCLSGNLMDADQHILHVWIVPHVPLCSGGPL